MGFNTTAGYNKPQGVNIQLSSATKRIACFSFFYACFIDILHLPFNWLVIKTPLIRKTSDRFQSVLFAFLHRSDQWAVCVAERASKRVCRRKTSRDVTGTSGRCAAVCSHLSFDKILTNFATHYPAGSISS